MIKRDEHNIICQHNPELPSYLDGGDSASRTGLLAMTDSIYDIREIPYFENKGLIVRHPYQYPYNNTRTTSRDQLIMYSAGLERGSERSKRIFWSRVKSFFFCQNILSIDLSKKTLCPDILSPSHISHLIKIAKIYWLYPFFIIGWPWLILDIMWSCFIKPKDESNQIIAMCNVAGIWALQLYVFLHYDYTVPLKIYWSKYPFRDQNEIEDILINYIKVRIK